MITYFSKSILDQIKKKNAMLYGYNRNTYKI